MLMIFLCLLAGGLIGLSTIRWYDPDTLFRYGELSAAAACVIGGMVLYGMSPTPASLSLGVVLGLLCSCTVTDALRSWLPLPLTLPLLAAGVWHVRVSQPWLLTPGLVWSGIWSAFYGVRYLLYRYRNGADCPGGGDILLAGVAGLCCHAFSGLVLTFAITGHQLWGTLRHHHIAPFGPWLSVAVAIQLLYF